jgi:NhaP-type Na+/H+ or K+/H+ antiporter
VSPFAVLAVTLVFGLLGSEWLRKRSISLPLTFTVVGAAIGQHGLGWLDLTPTAELTKEVIAITLGLLLFSEASNLNIRQVVAEANLEARLVSICVLSSIGIGGALAWLLFPGEKLAVLLLIGAALAPTDASLSLPFNANPAVPARLRNALNVESGLSDGVVAPFVAFFIPLVLAERARIDHTWVLNELRHIVLAVAIGATAGFVGGWLIRIARERGWTTTEMAQLAFMGLAAATFFSSGNWDGNRYIAAFIGGIVAGSILRADAHVVSVYTETTGSALSYLVWVIFGAVLVPLALGRLFDWNAVIFAVLALTVMRMVPMAVALAGLGLRRDTMIMMGWFAPRGLPSTAFLVTALVAWAGSGTSTDTFIAAMTWTILLSVLLHGLTALPLARWYTGRLPKTDTSIPELAPEIPHGDTGSHHAR